MQTPQQRSSGYGRGISAESIATDAATAVGLTPPSGCVSALVTTGVNARWRCDGTDPTTTVGHYLAENSSFEFFGDDVDKVKFINLTGSSTIFVTYFV